MRTPARWFALVTIVGLAAASAALAAHVVMPFGVYKGKDLKGASFKVAANGKTANFHGMVVVSLLCGSKAPPTGQSSAKLVLNSSSAPSIKINNGTGAFSGKRRYNGDTVRIVGKFSLDAKTMVFTVKTSGKCSSSKYTFHSG
jgi:hypothetical protein